MYVPGNAVAAMFNITRVKIPVCVHCVNGDGVVIASRNAINHWGPYTFSQHSLSYSYTSIQPTSNSKPQREYKT